MLLPLVPTPSASFGRLAVLAAEGAVVCTLGDQLHVRFGVLSYPHPELAGQAWWVPFLFFFSVLSMLLAYPLTFRGCKRALGWPAARATVDARAARRALLEFFLAYAVTAVAAARPVLVLLALTGAFGLRLWLDWRAADDLGHRALVAALPFVAAAIVAGPLVEATLIALGQFRYEHPHVLGFAMWLPALYLHAAWAGRAMVHAFLGRPPAAA
jgi:hypothetical protein